MQIQALPTYAINSVLVDKCAASEKQCRNYSNYVKVFIKQPKPKDIMQCGIPVDNVKCVSTIDFVSQHNFVLFSMDFTRTHAQSQQRDLTVPLIVRSDPTNPPAFVTLEMETRIGAQCSYTKHPPARSHPAPNGAHTNWRTAPSSRSAIIRAHPECACSAKTPFACV